MSSIASIKGNCVPDIHQVSSCQEYIQQIMKMFVLSLVVKKGLIIIEFYLSLFRAISTHSQNSFLYHDDTQQACSTFNINSSVLEALIVKFMPMMAKFKLVRKLIFFVQVCIWSIKKVHLCPYFSSRVCVLYIYIYIYT